MHVEQRKSEANKRGRGDALLVAQIKDLLVAQEARLSEKLDHLALLHDHDQRNFVSVTQSGESFMDLCHSKRDSTAGDASKLDKGLEYNGEERKSPVNSGAHHVLPQNDGDWSPDADFVSHNPSEFSMATSAPSKKKYSHVSTGGVGHRLAIAMARNSGNDTDGSRHFGFEPIVSTGPRSSWKSLLGSVQFEIVMQAVTMMNVVSMTVSVTIELREQHGSSYLRVVEFSFVVCFTLELMLKLVVFRRQLFRGQDGKWNVLDVVVVLCGWAHLLLSLLGAWTLNITFVRIVRVVRTLRLARLFQTIRRFFPSMHLVLHILAKSLYTVASFAWFTLIFSFMFMLAIVELEVQYLSGDPDPVVRESLLEDWGSPAQVLLTMYMCVSGGAEWRELARSLLDADVVGYAILVLFIVLFHFMAVHIMVAIFVYRTLLFAQRSNDRDWRLQRIAEFVNQLHDVFGAHVDSVTFEDFCAVMDSGNPVIAVMMSELGVNAADVQQLLFSLSRQATVDVLFEQLAVGCIKMRDTATRADLLTLTDAVEEVQAHLVDTDVDPSPAPKFVSHTTSLMSSNHRPLHIVEVPECDFVRKLLDRDVLSRLQTGEDGIHFRSSVTSAVQVLLSCDGGCGFVISPLGALTAIQRKRVDFQVTDKRFDFPKGYMTERLRDVHVDDPAFAKAMQEFSSHSATDRWPADHEAGGLPKDGYMLLTHRGRLVKGAAKIVGIPAPPYSWEGVGTRHSTALGLCWAMRFFPAVVLVRSDSGQMHGLFFSNGNISAIASVKGKGSYSNLKSFKSLRIVAHDL